MTLIYERLAKLETMGENQCKKVNEIHKMLVGNGQVGLLAEWNQWKGGIKLFGKTIGIIISILSIIVGFLVYIK